MNLSIAQHNLWRRVCCCAGTGNRVPRLGVLKPLYRLPTGLFFLRWRLLAQPCSVNTRSLVGEYIATALDWLRLGLT